jgi:AAA domain
MCFSLTDSTPVWEYSEQTTHVDSIDDHISTTPTDNPEAMELATLLIQRVDRHCQTFADITNKFDSVEVMSANGSAKSIVDWAQKANLDQYQKHLFEVFCSNFLSTFHEDCRTNEKEIRILCEERDRLNLLSGIATRQSKQLICLLHGPGGSGKTTVINLLLLYAKEFCSYLDYYNFHENMIIVTTMSGIAATHILGETVHSAANLYAGAKFSPEHFERWEDARLLIIDEISYWIQISIVC